MKRKTVIVDMKPTLKRIDNLANYIEYFYKINGYKNTYVNNGLKDIMLKIELNNLIIINKDRGIGMSTFMLAYAHAKMEVEGKRVLFITPNGDGTRNVMHRIKKHIEYSNSKNELTKNSVRSCRNKGRIVVANEYYDRLSKMEKDIIIYDDSTNTFNEQDSLLSFLDTKEIHIGTVEKIGTPETIKKDLFTNLYYTYKDSTEEGLAVIDAPWYYSKEFSEGLKLTKIIDGREIELKLKHEDFMNKLKTFEYMKKDGWDITSKWFDIKYKHKYSAINKDICEDEYDEDNLRDYVITKEEDPFGDIIEQQIVQQCLKESIKDEDEEIRLFIRYLDILWENIQMSNLIKEPKNVFYGLKNFLKK